MDLCIEFVSLYVGGIWLASKQLVFLPGFSVKMRFCLYNLEQMGVVVVDQEGPTYFNALNESEDRNVQGYLVPVSNDCPPDQPELVLTARLNSLAWGEVGLSNQTAQEVQQLLLEISSTDCYQVDHTMLHQSCRGWVHIKIIPQGAFSHFQGAGPLQAVLIWPSGC